MNDSNRALIRSINKLFLMSLREFFLLAPFLANAAPCVIILIEITKLYILKCWNLFQFHHRTVLWNRFQQRQRDSLQLNIKSKNMFSMLSIHTPSVLILERTILGCKYIWVYVSISFEHLDPDVFLRIVLGKLWMETANSFKHLARDSQLDS